MTEKLQPAKKVRSINATDRTWNILRQIARKNKRSMSAQFEVIMEEKWPH